MATYHPSRKLSTLDEPDTRETAGEVRTNSSVIYFCGPLHMDKQRQDDQLEPIEPVTGYSLEDLQGAMETGGKRGSGRSGQDMMIV